MYVVLDTNIIIKDYYFRSPKFQALFSYLQKTPHKLIVPKIVIEELKRRYSIDLENLHITAEKLDRESQNLIGSKIQANKIDLVAEGRKYSDFLTSFLKDKKVIVPEYNTNHYEDIINRALFRKAPFKQNGTDHGFKDAVIWETVKELVCDKDYDFIAFISNNTNQFADPLNENLNSELLEEIEKYKNKFLYFSKLESFLETYSEKIAFISQEKLQNCLDLEIIIKKAKGEFSEELLKNVYQPRFSKPVYDITLEETRIVNFFISKADKNYYYVEAVGKAESWVVYWNPLDGDFDQDDVVTWFEASFKVGKSDEKIELDEFSLDMIEEPPF